MRVTIKATFSATAGFLTWALAFAGGADAAFVSSDSSIIDDSSVVTIQAPAVETNTITVTRTTRGNVRIVDSTAALTPTSPCVSVDANTVDCPIDQDNPWVIQGMLGPENDVFSSGASEGLILAGEGSLDQSQIYGDTGEDHITGTPGSDTLDGGEGSDYLDGRRGRDQLRAGPGSDYVVANDSMFDVELNCGDDVADILLRDNIDPAGTGCETAATTPAVFSTSFEQRMPDLSKGIYKGLSAAEIADTVNYLLPTRLEEEPVGYAVARKLAGREIEPFEVIDQKPGAGVGVLASLGSPLKVKLTYWDPELDAKPGKCLPSTMVRSRFQKSKGLSLTKALIGLEYREGVKGNEGDAQELLRRYGCTYDPQIVYSRSREKGGSVQSASFKSVVKSVRNPKSGKLTRKKSWVVKLKAKFAREGNDYLLFFSDDPNAPANQLPISEQSRIAKKQPSAFRLQLREAATGRVVRGARVELRDGDPKATVIASGRTDAEGQVDLQFVAQGPNDLQLNAFKDAVDPASGEPVSQQAEVTITSTTPGRTWTSLGGRTFVEGPKKGFRRTGGVGSNFAGGDASASSVGDVIKYVTDISLVWNAIALADLQAAALGLSSAQRDELASIFADMSGVSQASDARKMLLKHRIEPTLAVGSAGKICESNGPPQIRSGLAPGFNRSEVIAGGGVFARIDCGRLITTSTTGLGLLPGGWVAGSAPLIANDGAGLIANDGSSLIANDGASFNDGTGGLLSEDSSGLLANDGASLLPVSPLMSNHGSGIVSNHSGAIVSNNSGALISTHGGGFNPLGPGTSLMSLDSR